MDKKKTNLEVPEYISHLYQKENGEWVFQSNEEHSEGVADLAEQFASEIGLTGWGRLAGLLHDIGKTTRAFQAHIRRSSGFDPDAPRLEGSQHARIGGNIAKDMNPAYTFILGNVISGHHRGLYNKEELINLLSQAIPNEVRVPDGLNSITLSGLTGKKPNDINQVIRMLFSCLVDADYLDTERFMDSNRAEMREGRKSLPELLVTLEAYLERLKKNAPDTPVNKIRRSVQKQCRENSNGPCGHYELSIPTGGGKTLASVLWALRHAVANGMKRVVIAIPYTSIIEQTCMTLQNIFGKENVLEHHSQVDPGTYESDDEKTRARLAMENWDVPIVVTTNVRLFESMFSHKPSACRRLHNLANSVIVLDEIQTLPPHYYTPLLGAFDTYQRQFHTSFLYTTASQPLLFGTLQGVRPEVKCIGLEKRPESIVRFSKEELGPLDRVKLSFLKAPRSYEEIADLLREEERVLCIVNTRRNAREICEKLGDDENAFLLSRLMCPVHIKEVLEQIKERLKNPGNRVRVVSTQLVEAGVDLDFPKVYRQEAGLDSIIQAAGRCNREGKMTDKGETVVFSLENPKAMPSGFIKTANQARLNLIGIEDWFAPETMELYFDQLCSKIESFDADSTLELLSYRQLNFQEASETFRLIRETGLTVIVPWKAAEELVRQYKYVGPSKGLLRRLSQYSVNISEYDFKEMAKKGLIEEVNGLFVVTDSRCYDKKYGLDVKNLWLDEVFVI